MGFPELQLFGRHGRDASFFLTPEHDPPRVDEASPDFSAALEYFVHEYFHFCLGARLIEAEGSAAVGDGDGVAGLRHFSDGEDGEDEGGVHGGCSMGVLDDDEGRVLGGVVDKFEEVVGAWQFEGFLLDVVLFFELVSHRELRR